MTITGKTELLDLLSEIQLNCGDIRGRDGEYLNDQLEKAYKQAENLDIEGEE